MKNYSRLNKKTKGFQIFSLLNDEGEYVSAFDLYVGYLIKREYSQDSINRYSHAVANFIDYLTECRVFGFPATLREISFAVENYIPTRLRANYLRSQNKSKVLDEEDQELSRIVVDLDIRQLSQSSLPNTLAAINLFLKLSYKNHSMALEYARHNKIPITELTTPEELVEILSSVGTMSRFQKTSMVQNSMLAGVIRLNQNGITVSSGIASKYAASSQSNDSAKDFPMDYLSKLFAAATSHRDKALWTLMAAAGLRSHEAAQIRWDNINIKERLIFIEDPGKLRFTANGQKLRFKGRAVAHTYLLPALKDAFFNELSLYVKKEAIPGVAHDFVFQDIRLNQNGRPYYEMSDTAMTKAFNKACDLAGVPKKRDGSRYTRHSLRHFYGVFTLNYLPVPGGYGLKLKEVQMLMGHRHIDTTSKYAREDSLVMELKLQFADRSITENNIVISDFPTLIAKRLQDELNKIRKKQ